MPANDTPEASLKGRLLLIPNTLDLGCTGNAEDGIASCWLGWFDERVVKQALGIPRAKKVDLLLCLGYPADETVRSKNRKPLDEIRKYF